MVKDVKDQVLDLAQVLDVRRMDADGGVTVNAWLTKQIMETGVNDLDH